MPGGEFIPNGSMHYNLAFGAGGAMKGEDPIPYDDIGASRRHKGRMRVTLRFNTRAEATAALAQIKETAQAAEVEGKFEVVIEVPTRKHTKDQANRDFPNPNAQVRVEW